MRLLVGLLFSGTVIVVAACSGSNGSGVSCSSADPCPNDPPLTSQEVSECEQIESQCSGFAAYYDCAFGQIKCTSAGTLDDQATQQGIEANCQSQAEAIRGCAISVGGIDGGSGFDSGPACGFSGEACCTTGTPCQDGCCDTSGRCVIPGEECSGGGSVCSNGACTPCGAPGQACCPGDSCGSGCCDLSSTPTTCVAAGSACAPIGSNATVCTAGFCSLCGSDGETCCPGSACPGSTPSLPLSCSTTGTNTCGPCGILGEPCCPGAAPCTSGTCNGTTCQ